jgi:hypothetical protein
MNTSKNRVRTADKHLRRILFLLVFIPGKGRLQRQPPAQSPLGKQTYIKISFSAGFYVYR